MTYTASLVEALASEAVRQWNAAGNPHLSTGAIGVARVAVQLALLQPPVSPDQEREAIARAELRGLIAWEVARIRPNFNAIIHAEEWDAADAILSRIQSLRSAPEWRAEVVAFAHLMEAQLRANDHKPGWRGENPWPLLDRLHEEAAELAEELQPGSRTDLATWRLRLGAEAADVANFAMMIADVCGVLAPPTTNEGVRSNTSVPTKTLLTNVCPECEEPKTPYCRCDEAWFFDMDGKP